MKYKLRNLFFSPIKYGILEDLLNILVLFNTETFKQRTPGTKMKTKAQDKVYLLGLRKLTCNILFSNASPSPGDPTETWPTCKNIPYGHGISGLRRDLTMKERK